MVGYNTQVSKDNYKIKYETDDREFYRHIEDEIRKQIDKSNEKKQILNFGGFYGTN